MSAAGQAADTGATDAEIEMLAAFEWSKFYEMPWGSMTPGPYNDAVMERYRADARHRYQRLVPPGYVITRAENVLSDDARAAIKTVCDKAVEIHEDGTSIGYDAWKAVGVLRDLLARIAGEAER